MATGAKISIKDKLRRLEKQGIEVRIPYDGGGDSGESRVETYKNGKLLKTYYWGDEEIWVDSLLGSFDRNFHVNSTGDYDGEYGTAFVDLRKGTITKRGAARLIETKIVEKKITVPRSLDTKNFTIFVISDFQGPLTWSSDKDCCHTAKDGKKFEDLCSYIEKECMKILTDEDDYLSYDNWYEIDAEAHGREVLVKIRYEYYQEEEIIETFNI